MDTHLIDCGDLKTMVRVSFVVMATLWGPNTKEHYLNCGDLKNTFKQRQVPTNHQAYDLCINIDKEKCIEYGK